MDQGILKKATVWTQPPFDRETCHEIQQLIDTGHEKELTDRFYRDLEFGTGGLRGVIGAGTNRMNIYTVGSATQGLANYILKTGEKEPAVVIAYDSRRMSNEFSRECSVIFAANGIKVYLFEDITPTPLASYAIRKLGALSGIVITASHNPPEYNGYKVYWKDGGQVVPPHDKLIIQEVQKVGIGEIRKIDFEEGVRSGRIEMIGEQVIASYIADLEKRVLKGKSASSVKIVYSPLHGTGYRIVPRVLAHFGFGNVILEPAQAKPDGNFPTVKYPNPEEREAMTRSLELAERENADIVLATDPDADRMGVGFKGRDGGYVLINGNQIGTMLEYYLLSRLREKGELPKNAAVIKTIVTTELQREIAGSFGCAIFDVLTGFKYIASQMERFDETGSHTFIFGGEESYGYLPVDFVRDKDAVSSCYFFAEMVDWLKGRGMTLQDFLDEIYGKHGLYLEDLVSLTLKGMDGSERIKRMMEGMRATPPRHFAGIVVNRVDDIGRLVRRDLASGTEEPIPDLPKSDVLQFFLADGSKITARPSGTEPKIKFYFSVREKVTAETLGKGRERALQKIDTMKSDLLRIVESIS